LNKYTGRPESRAGKFVKEFFSAIDSRVREHTIATAMAHVVSEKHSLPIA
jgi:hypothetical protein